MDLLEILTKCINENIKFHVYPPLNDTNTYPIIRLEKCTDKINVAIDIPIDAQKIPDFYSNYIDNLDNEIYQSIERLNNEL